MSKHANPFGLIGYNELSPYVQKLLNTGGGNSSGGSTGSSNGIKTLSNYSTCNVSSAI